MSAGSWDKPMNLLDIPYYQEITVMRFRFTRTVARSGYVTWWWVKGKVKSLDREA